MQKAWQIAEEIIAEYSRNIKEGKAPELQWKMGPAEHEDGFCATYAGGIVNLESRTALGTAYGLSQLTAGIASGHLPDFLGRQAPRFALRPLWLGSDETLKISRNIALGVPAFLNKDQGVLDLICRRVLELGYNALIFGNNGWGSANAALQNAEVLQKFSCIREYGIKVILKPSLIHFNEAKCPIDPSYQHTIKASIQEFLKLIPEIDYVFWESALLHADFLHHPAARDWTFYELVLTEVKLLESSLKDKVPLFYFVPAFDKLSATLQSNWLPRLCDDVANNTILAFPAVSGDLYGDHQLPHPFWEILRASKYSSSTRLMPILNIGGIKQGEGLWPVLTYDILEKYVSRCYGHPFAGAIILTGAIPGKGGVLDCNLWVASQALWKEKSPLLMTETWFKAYRPDIDFGLYSHAFKEIREIAIQLSYMRSLAGEKGRDSLTGDECRALAEKVASELWHLRLFFAKIDKTYAKKSEKPGVQDYFLYFARDAKRVIAQFLQSFNIPAANIIDGDEGEESFWIQKTGFQPQPQKGLPGSRMEAIYKENRI